MTKKEMFGLIATINAENEEIVNFCKHEIELLENKKSKSSSTKTQKENVKIMESIANALEMVNKPVTITELQNEVVEMKVFSNQKLSALLKKMVESGKVVKTVEKKKSYFSIATEEVGE